MCGPSDCRYWVVAYEDTPRLAGRDLRRRAPLRWCAAAYQLTSNFRAPKRADAAERDARATVANGKREACRGRMQDSRILTASRDQALPRVERVSGKEGEGVRVGDDPVATVGWVTHAIPDTTKDRVGLDPWQ